MSEITKSALVSRPRSYNLQGSTCPLEKYAIPFWARDARRRVAAIVSRPLALHLSALPAPFDWLHTRLFCWLLGPQKRTTTGYEHLQQAPCLFSNWKESQPGKKRRRSLGKILRALSGVPHSVRSEYLNSRNNPICPANRAAVRCGSTREGDPGSTVPKSTRTKQTTLGGATILLASF